MTRRVDGTLADTGKTERPRVTETPASRSEEWIRSIPGELLEPHPLVKELRLALRAKDSTLADREREIARLRVALAFGIRELPLDRGLPETPAST